jgi:hypothetical protein
MKARTLTEGRRIAQTPGYEYFLAGDFVNASQTLHEAYDLFQNK